MDLDALDLAARFPAPGLDAWRTAAEKALGGRPVDRLDRATLEGLVVPPLRDALGWSAALAALRSGRWSSSSAAP